MKCKVKNESWKADIKAAKELLYPKSVIEALEAEKDSNKRNLILRSARLKMKD